MRIAFIAMVVMAAAPWAQAAGNGEHPAIAARRVIASQGYDYASAFYRHPAGLSLVTHRAGSINQTDGTVASRKAGAHPAAPPSVPRK